MAKLLVIYDPIGNLGLALPSSLPDHIRPRTAQLDVADGLDGKDIYDLARKLSEMLLEQVA